MQPLEIIFGKLAQNGISFPGGASSAYLSRYTGILSELRSNYYKDINVGLAACSNDFGVYTDHGPDHFDEVVKYAGLLLGVKDGERDPSGLSAYELYLLLVAIRLHDVGNIYGREAHEKQVFSILHDMGKLSGDDALEKRNIANIAEAHGGKTPDGSKDTIGRLKANDSYDHVEFRPQLIAAIVRFADEICENRKRANQVLLDKGKLPKHSEIYHKYASTIKSVTVQQQEKSMSIKYFFLASDAICTWGKGTEAETSHVYLIDEIFARLDKMDLERRYCNRFLAPYSLGIDRIRAEIEICDNEYNPIKEIAILIEDEGYPDMRSPIGERAELKEFREELLSSTLENERAKHAGG